MAAGVKAEEQRASGIGGPSNEVRTSTESRHNSPHGEWAKCIGYRRGCQQTSVKGGTGALVTQRSGGDHLDGAAAAPRWRDLDLDGDALFQLIDMADDAHPPASGL